MTGKTEKQRTRAATATTRRTRTRETKTETETHRTKRNEQTQNQTRRHRNPDTGQGMRSRRIRNSPPCSDLLHLSYSDRTCTTRARANGSAHHNAGCVVYVFLSLSSPVICSLLSMVCWCAGACQLLSCLLYVMF